MCPPGGFAVTYRPKSHVAKKIFSRVYHTALEKSAAPFVSPGRQGMGFPSVTGDLRIPPASPARKSGAEGRARALAPGAEAML